MSDEPLLIRIEQAFKDERFNDFELFGFQTNPQLAFIAGAAVGYRMAVKDIESAAIAATEQSGDTG